MPLLDSDICIIKKYDSRTELGKKALEDFFSSAGFSRLPRFSESSMAVLWSDDELNSVTLLSEQAEEAVTCFFSACISNSQPALIVAWIRNNPHFIEFSGSQALKQTLDTIDVADLSEDDQMTLNQVRQNIASVDSWKAQTQTQQTSHGFFDNRLFYFLDNTVTSNSQLDLLNWLKKDENIVRLMNFDWAIFESLRERIDFSKLNTLILEIIENIKRMEALETPALTDACHRKYCNQLSAYLIRHWLSKHENMRSFRNVFFSLPHTERENALDFLSSAMDKSLESRLKELVNMLATTAKSNVSQEMINEYQNILESRPDLADALLLSTDFTLLCTKYVDPTAWTKQQLFTRSIRLMKLLEVVFVGRTDEEIQQLAMNLVGILERGCPTEVQMVLEALEKLTRRKPVLVKADIFYNTFSESITLKKRKSRLSGSRKVSCSEEEEAYKQQQSFQQANSQFCNNIASKEQKDVITQAFVYGAFPNPSESLDSVSDDTFLLVSWTKEHLDIVASVLMERPEPDVWTYFKKFKIDETSRRNLLERLFEKLDQSEPKVTDRKSSGELDDLSHVLFQTESTDFSLAKSVSEQTATILGVLERSTLPEHQPIWDLIIDYINAEQQWTVADKEKFARDLLSFIEDDLTKLTFYQTLFGQLALGNIEILAESFEKKKNASCPQTPEQPPRNSILSRLSMSAGATESPRKERSTSMAKTPPRDPKKVGSIITNRASLSGTPQILKQPFSSNLASNCSGISSAQEDSNIMKSLIQQLKNPEKANVRALINVLRADVDGLDPAFCKLFEVINTHDFHLKVADFLLRIFSELSPEELDVVTEWKVRFLKKVFLMPFEEMKSLLPRLREKFGDANVDGYYRQAYFNELFSKSPQAILLLLPEVVQRFSVSPMNRFWGLMKDSREDEHSAKLRSALELLLKDSFSKVPETIAGEELKKLQLALSNLHSLSQLLSPEVFSSTLKEVLFEKLSLTVSWKNIEKLIAFVGSESFSLEQKNILKTLLKNWLTYKASQPVSNKPLWQLYSEEDDFSLESSTMDISAIYSSANGLGLIDDTVGKAELPVKRQVLYKNELLNILDIEHKLLNADESSIATILANIITLSITTETTVTTVPDNTETDNSTNRRSVSSQIVKLKIAELEKLSNSICFALNLGGHKTAKAFDSVLETNLIEALVNTFNMTEQNEEVKKGIISILRVLFMANPTEFFTKISNQTQRKTVNFRAGGNVNQIDPWHLVVKHLELQDFIKNETWEEKNIRLANRKTSSNPQEKFKNRHQQQGWLPLNPSKNNVCVYLLQDTDEARKQKEFLRNAYDDHYFEFQKHKKLTTETRATRYANWSWIKSFFSSSTTQDAENSRYGAKKLPEDFVDQYKLFEEGDCKKTSDISILVFRVIHCQELNVDNLEMPLITQNLNTVLSQWSKPRWKFWGEPSLLSQLSTAVENNDSCDFYCGLLEELVMATVLLALKKDLTKVELKQLAQVKNIFAEIHQAKLLNKDTFEKLAETSTISLLNKCDTDKNSDWNTMRLLESQETKSVEDKANLLVFYEQFFDKAPKFFYKQMHCLTSELQCEVPIVPEGVAEENIQNDASSSQETLLSSCYKKLVEFSCDTSKACRNVLKKIKRVARANEETSPEAKESARIFSRDVSIASSLGRSRHGSFSCIASAALVQEQNQSAGATHIGYAHVNSEESSSQNYCTIM